MLNWPLPAGHQAHHPRVTLDDRLGKRIGFGLATDHHGQHTIDRTGLTTGYRRIEKTQAMLGRNSRQLTRHIGRGGGVIDQNGARRHTGERALLAQNHAAQVVIVTDATHHQFGARHRLTRGRRRAAGIFTHPLLGFARRAVIDRHLMPFACQMPGHRIPHDAQTEKRDLCHSNLLQI